MSHFSSPAFTLRRIEYGDTDMIVTFFTRDQGTVSLIAKAAKKSRKRFGGALDLFTLSEIVYSSGRKTGRPPLIQEAAVMGQFEHIRNCITKTAYASFWAEIIRFWTEERQPQKELYALFSHALSALDKSEGPVLEIHLLFLMRFLCLSGLSPNLEQCQQCKTRIQGAMEKAFYFSNARGGVLCQDCQSPQERTMAVSPGTLKLLDWIGQGDLAQARRVRFSSQAGKEALRLLESFVPFQLGAEPKSLRFLLQMERR